MSGKAFLLGIWASGAVLALGQFLFAPSTAADEAFSITGSQAITLKISAAPVWVPTVAPVQEPPSPTLAESQPLGALLPPTLLTTPDVQDLGLAGQPVYILSIPKVTARPLMPALPPPPQIMVPPPEPLGPVQPSITEKIMAAIPWGNPAPNVWYSSSFGVRPDPFNGELRQHEGMDLAGPEGQPITATAPGTVVRAGQYPGYGNMVEVSHGFGLTTRYAHMQAISVKPGARVGAGATLGTLGNTGRSTGAHLHYEVRVKNEPINPYPFLTRKEGLRESLAEKILQPALGSVKDKSKTPTR